MGCGSSVPVLDAAERSSLAVDYKLTENQIDNLNSRFQRYDRDRTGKIGLTEFCRGLEYEKPTAYIEKLFSMFDKDRSGQIDFREFVSAVTQFSDKSAEDKLRFAFWVIDDNLDGLINKDEMKELVITFQLSSPSQSQAKVGTVFDQCDLNRDGFINFEEFRLFAEKFPSLIFPVFSLWNRAAELANIPPK